jgi:hypothetical protein
MHSFSVTYAIVLGLLPKNALVSSERSLFTRLGRNGLGGISAASIPPSQLVRAPSFRIARYICSRTFIQDVQANPNRNPRR